MHEHKSTLRITEKQASHNRCQIPLITIMLQTIHNCLHNKKFRILFNNKNIYTAFIGASSWKRKISRHNILIQKWDNHIHVVHLVHEATSTNFICSFISLSKMSAYKNHGWFMAGFIFPQGSTQRDPSNSTAPFGHMVNLNFITTIRYPNRWVS